MVDFLDIIEAKKILITIKDVYKLDLNNYSYSYLTRRLNHILQIYNFSSADELTEKLSNESKFFDLFVRDFFVHSNEMFRDPSMWVEIKDNIIPRLVNQYKKITIWLPDCMGGSDLYTLCILLHEINLADKVSIIASSFLKYDLEQIKEGIIEVKKMDYNAANYSRYNESSKFSSFYSISGTKSILKKELFDNVEFTKINIMDNVNPSKVHMIIYRNKLLLYNKILQNDVLSEFYKSLISNGFLIVGIKENLNTIDYTKNFKLVNEEENIYRKI